MAPSPVRTIGRFQPPGRRHGGSPPGVPRLAMAVAAAFVLIPGLARAAGMGGAHAGLRLAYIDPGTGSFVVQAIVAALAAVAVTLRLYWQRVKAFLGLSGDRTEGNEDPDGKPPSP